MWLCKFNDGPPGGLLEAFKENTGLRENTL